MRNKKFRICPDCKKRKNYSLFSKSKRNKNGIDCYCKECVMKRAPRYFKKRNEKRTLIKARLVKYKGNKCFVCKVENLPLTVFQFHHMNPKKKDFQISLNMTFNKNLMKEVDKCALVCANCHCVVHHGNKRLSDIEESI